MTKPIPPVEFLAYIPPIKTALNFGGYDGEFSVKFEGSLYTSPQAALLIQCTGKQLKITVEVLDDVEEKGKKKTTETPEPTVTGRRKQIEEK